MHPSLGSFSLSPAFCHAIRLFVKFAIWGTSSFVALVILLLLKEAESIRKDKGAVEKSCC